MGRMSCLTFHSQHLLAIYRYLHSKPNYFHFSKQVPSHICALYIRLPSAPNVLCSLYFPFNLFCSSLKIQLKHNIICEASTVWHLWAINNFPSLSFYDARYIIPSRRVIDSLTLSTNIRGEPAVWRSALSWDYHASVISTFKSRVLFYPLGHLKETGS